MNQILIAPILIPLAGGIIALLTKAQPKFRNVWVVCCGLLQIAASFLLFNSIYQQGSQVYTLGGWPAPFGIVLGVDLLSATMVMLSALVAFAALIYSFGYFEEDGQRTFFFPFFFFLWAAINGSFLTGDIFNLFVFFEVMLMSTYCLLLFMGEEKQLEAGLKMMTMSLIGSTMLLMAISMLYAYTGTLNMADISEKVHAIGPPPVFNAIAVMFLVVFGLKAAMVPLHFWLPDVHASAPTPISAMLSGLLIKVGLYGMLRLFTLLFGGLSEHFQSFLLLIAVVTMVFGALGALAQNNFKRLLAYSSISQMGYMIMALALFSISSISAMIFFIINHAVIKATLFLSAGILQDTRGSMDLDKQGGLLRSAPLAAWFMLIASFALAGLPPFGGFFGKLMVLQAGFQSGQYVVTAIALAVSFVTLFYIMRAWQKISWGEVVGKVRHAVKRRMIIPVGILSLGCMLLGLITKPLIALTDEIGYQVMHPEIYINAMHLQKNADVTTAAHH